MRQSYPVTSSSIRTILGNSQAETSFFDQWFLDRVATHMLAFEGDSHVEWFAGNYTEYEADRKRRLGDADPTRVKYKPKRRA